SCRRPRRPACGGSGRCSPSARSRRPTPCAGCRSPSAAACRRRRSRCAAWNGRSGRGRRPPMLPTSGLRALPGTVFRELAGSLAHYGSGVIRLFDTAIGQVRELAQREPGKVAMYVCGPTVYDVPHLGHGRMVLVYDVLRRYLEWGGVAVRHVSNITDIDDNIITKAAEEHRPADEVAKHY